MAKIALFKAGNLETASGPKASVSVLNDGRVTFLVIGAGTGRWRAHVAFAEVLGGVVLRRWDAFVTDAEPIATLLLDSNNGTLAGWLVEGDGTFAVGGFADAAEGAAAIAMHDMGAFAGAVDLESTPKAYLAFGARASVNGVQYTYGAAGWWRAASPTILDRPLRVASFGPSTADNGICVCDMFSYSAYPGSGTTTYYPANGSLFDSIKAADKMHVACGGVGGSTVDASYSRYATTESATRKAPFDIAKKSPDVVLFRTSTINNVIGYNATPSDATLAALVDKELEIVDDFVARGMRVVVSPILGYSQSVSAELLAIRRDAASRINRLFSLRSTGAAWVLVSVSAISSPDMAFLAGMSDDGVHPTSLCGKVLGSVENLFIDSWYLPSPIFGADVFDMSKLMSANDGTLAITDMSGVVSSGRVSKSTYHQFNIAAQVGGKIKFNFYGGVGSALSAAYAANTNRDVAFRFKVLDSNEVERPDVVASVYTRVTLRNAAAASIAFDATYSGYANETSTLIGVPAEAPGITQSYSEITFSEAGNFILQIFPLRIRNAAS